MLDLDLVCVDLETTGGNPAWHRIIEVGLVEIDRDGTVREWATLVNPGVRIPPGITQFTGITNGMVAAAPSFEDVHREVLARLRGRTLVAHNARFDYGFLRAEFLRLEVRWTAKVLCTVKLSRKLYPGQPRHNLDAVIARHGLHCAARHRALADARVLRDLLGVLAHEAGRVQLASVVEELLRDVPLPPQLPPGLADELPECPGVYRFYGNGGGDGEGDGGGNDGGPGTSVGASAGTGDGDALLYVGKSRNIRQRVLEQFAEAQRSTKGCRLATQVRRVSWMETAGELGAQLHEARAVRRDRPLHNRRPRDSPATWTLVLVPCAAADGAIEPAPGRVEMREFDALDADARGETYGLFRDARSAQRALAGIVRAHDLCAKAVGLEDGAGSCFAYQFRRCRGACTGREPGALHDTRVRLALAAQRLKPWPYRGRIAIVERDWRGEQDCHVFDGWRWLGTVRELTEAARLADDAPFEDYVYRLVKRWLADVAAGRARATVVDLAPTAAPPRPPADRRRARG